MLRFFYDVTSGRHLLRRNRRARRRPGTSDQRFGACPQDPTCSVRRFRKHSLRAPGCHRTLSSLCGSSGCGGRSLKRALPQVTRPRSASVMAPPAASPALRRSRRCCGPMRLSFCSTRPPHRSYGNEQLVQKACRLLRARRRIIIAHGSQTVLLADTSSRHGRDKLIDAGTPRERSTPVRTYDHLPGSNSIMPAESWFSAVAARL